jgi:hypothetical protein
MAITQALCRSFVADLMNGNFSNGIDNAGTEVFRMALYTSAATLGPSTGSYTAANEVPSANGYVTKGEAVTKLGVTGGTATQIIFADFSDVTWAASTITARGALMYNDTLAGDNSIFVLDFTTDRSSSAGDFTIQMPAPTTAAAIIRIDAGA